MYVICSFLAMDHLKFVIALAEPFCTSFPTNRNLRARSGRFMPMHAADNFFLQHSFHSMIMYAIFCCLLFCDLFFPSLKSIWVSGIVGSLCEHFFIQREHLRMPCAGVTVASIRRVSSVVWLDRPCLYVNHKLWGIYIICCQNKTTWWNMQYVGMFQCVG